MNFNAEEINLIAAFDMGNRRETLEMMEDIITTADIMEKQTKEHVPSTAHTGRKRLTTWCLK